MNIVLIDDDRAAERPLRAILTSHFRDVGVTIRHAGTFTDGLRLVKEHNASLALLDIGLPCMPDPYETLNCIQKFPKGCLVMIYSAHDDDAIIRAASEAGAIGFISKSDSVETKVRKIQEVVGNIISAKVRMKVDQHQGTMLTERKAVTLALPALTGIIGAAVAVLMFFSGELKGAWTAAKASGAREQAIEDRFVDHDTRLKTLENSAADQARWRSRVERNLVKLLQKLDIQPARDGE
jgi:DNA-binding NarL/FixJ family response regulator